MTYNRSKALLLIPARRPSAPPKRTFGASVVFGLSLPSPLRGQLKLFKIVPDDFVTWTLCSAEWGIAPD